MLHNMRIDCSVLATFSVDKSIWLEAIKWKCRCMVSTELKPTDSIFVLILSLYLSLDMFAARDRKKGTTQKRR